MTGPRATDLIWLVTYTTLYREGGPELERAAMTLAAEMTTRRGIPAAGVRLVRVECKRDFVDALEAVARDGLQLAELHFVGHSGMYGPMFRTTAMPEQFSPHEWRTLAIPFAPGGEAFFHACRTARWFAPFFARTFGVPASGFHWYTTFSTRPDRFGWEGPARLLRPPARMLPNGERPLYLIGCRGKKSDGLVGSVLKYTGLIDAEPMKRFLPEPLIGDATYDQVADLYAEVFTDIRVRKDEWRWLEARFPRPAVGPGPRVLDLGCGTGALLRALEDRIAHGVGVDASPGMVAVARRESPSDKLAFEVIDGPRLPFPDASFDVVVSLLSFRYLDWDPIMDEVRRVLAPGGRLLVVDMVTAPVESRDVPMLVRDVVKARAEQLQNSPYRQALRRLVADPRWKTMLTYNPIRAKHEYVWYFESRFPGRKVETLNVGWHNRVLAFDSGPLAPGRVAPQSYP
ncbi:MAG: class I SAM-dependent methyltransferase [Deltaproteobacteria bacterium]|nr:class I SAM-dependent methyltransferase [Deltaproteobacteria bacterium]